jgi:hypothetical protein
MNSREIYTLWRSKTPDLRYLRPRRWDQIQQVIDQHSLKSVLEFGSGVSTILFDSLGISVVSYETNAEYIEFVRQLCSPKVTFIHSPNKKVDISSNFDMALIDGILPRAPQLKSAINHARFYFLDDFERSIKANLSPLINGMSRIDNQSTTLAIFEDTHHGRS